MGFWQRYRAEGHDGGRWLVLLLLLAGVLAPTACVLWFMNAAVNNQRDASRQKLAEAYRGQLTLLRERMDSYWEKRAADLERETRDGPAPMIFERLVRRGLADSAVCVNRDGSPAYPAITTPTQADPVSKRADWMAARALESWSDPAAAAEAYAEIAKSEQDVSVAARAAQAQVRCLLRSDKNAALRVLEESFSGGRLLHGMDLGGRLIAADAQLLTLQLMQPGDKRFAPAARRLSALLNDYGGTAMPSAQRLFLMTELRNLAPEAAVFPTYAAERLAAEFLAAGRTHSSDAALEPSGLAETWKLAAPEGRVIALYRTATVVSAMHEFSSGLDVALTVTPPGNAAPRADESMPAGSGLPGWQISLSLSNSRPLDELARRQTLSYVWIGFLAIAVVTITALIAGQALRRQWRLARLKTDLVAAVSHELKSPVASTRLLVDTLLEDSRPDPVKTREYLELIAGENLRLTRLIDNFLTFSRMERNRQRFEFADTKPSDVIQSALTAMHERLQSPGCHLDVDVSPDLPALRADSDALTTVLLNLLDNAYKYTPDEKRISLRVCGDNGHVVFAVKDNGIGIASRDRKRIFRRFYQVDRRLSRETGGCGLGLSIIEFIVRAHGGTVSVESQPGAGSTFSVRIPCHERALEAIA